MAEQFVIRNERTKKFLTMKFGWAKAGSSKVACFPTWSEANSHLLQTCGPVGECEIVRFSPQQGKVSP